MLIHPQIDPVVFALGPLKVHWYGLMYFIGFLSFIHLGKKQIATRPWFNLSEKMLDDIFSLEQLALSLAEDLVTFYFISLCIILHIWMQYLHFGRVVCHFMVD